MNTLLSTLLRPKECIQKYKQTDVKQNAPEQSILGHKPKGKTNHNCMDKEWLQLTTANDNTVYARGVEDREIREVVLQE